MQKDMEERFLAIKEDEGRKKRREKRLEKEKERLGTITLPDEEGMEEFKK